MASGEQKQWSHSEQRVADLSLSYYSRYQTACSHIQGVNLNVRFWAQQLPTLVLSLVSSNSCEGKRVPLRATVSLRSGPGGEGLEERDSALSCSSRDKTIPSPCSSDESRVWAERKKEINACVYYAAGLCAYLCMWVCLFLDKTGKPCQSMRVYLLKKWQVTAALSEAQQQGQNVDGAGRLLGLLGTCYSRVSLGHTKLLGYWGGNTHTFDTPPLVIMTLITKPSLT